ncbi:MAG: phosphoribosylanthranilate isomerase [Flammeovirgaceae bacterium]|nr:phosphoribosylanthranilate isomerase [Flammeovirgaceae bacterium]
MATFEIKVCGMRSRENILEIASYHPDYLGFIFYKNSPRFVGENFQIPPELSPSIKRVGVFVNESTDLILEQAATHRLEYIQLHGDETPDQCQLLKENGLRVIKVFGVDRKFEREVVKPFEACVDYFLFDSKGKHPGGNGIPFDWQTLNNYQGSTPFFLSGGINPENVGLISRLKFPNLVAIDVNSGVEDSPGIKNKDKLKELLSKI